MLEAVRVSRIGYPQRYSKEMFVQRYWILGVAALNRAKQANVHDLCQVLVDCIVPQIWQRQNAKSGGENIMQQRVDIVLYKASCAKRTKPNQEPVSTKKLVFPTPRRLRRQPGQPNCQG